MSRKPRAGIRTQLLWLASLSAATALAVACAAFVTNDWQMLRDAKRQQVYRYGALIARTVAAELEAGDTESARRQLAGLRIEPTITSACLYDVSGRVVADYRRDGATSEAFPPIGGDARVSLVDDGGLSLSQPIFKDGARVGGLFLRATDDDVSALGANYMLIVCVVFGVSLLAAALFAAQMRRRLSTPFDRLSDAANRVSQGRDYSVRLESKEGGPMGDLFAAFNKMLDQFQESDEELKEVRDQLNHRVRARTQELHQEVLERRCAESVAAGQKQVLQMLASGQPLVVVLRALVDEIERHVLGIDTAITLLSEEDRSQFERPICRRALSAQQDALAPGRAAHRCVESGVPECDSDETGLRWAWPVKMSDGAVLAVIVALPTEDRELAAAERGVIEGACSLTSVAIEQRRGEEALKRAIRDANDANRAKSDFLANMSHEIRTPLNGILGFAELMLADADDLDAERRESLETICSSGRHLLTLINDVLDLSKIEAGELKIESALVDPHQLLAEVMSLLRVKATEKGITLELEWASEAPEQILTDPARLRQLMVNLVGNAVKFTDSGGVRVVATLIGGESREPRLRLDVIDTGVGIPAEKLDHVFQPFVQADESVTRRFGGTGLGLAICSRIVEALDGEISVQSTAGEGSTFSIEALTGPLDDVPLRNKTPTESLQDGAGSTDDAARLETRLDGRKYLVADDGETNRRLISLLLSRVGAIVQCAADGQEALAAATAESFDAVLMDMQMPVMDGYTATSKLRDAGYVSPIIALTAHAMKGDERRCLDAGCSDYLTKPIDSNRLLSVLSALDQPESKPVALDASDADPLPESATGSTPIESLLPTEDEEFYRAVEDFLTRAKVEVGEMRRLADAEEWESLRTKAHWLKGSGGTAGYPDLSHVALRLEEALKNEGGSAQVAECLTELESLRERLVVTLEPISVSTGETDA